MPITTVAHCGAGIEISEIYVNDMWVGNQSGWGGGGGEVCCLSIAAGRSKPVLIHFKWETCQILYVKQRRKDYTCEPKWHEMSIPINFSEEIPGHHFGLVLHFLVGHKVEAWTSDKGIAESDYHGPKFPFGISPKNTSSE